MREEEMAENKKELRHIIESKRSRISIEEKIELDKNIFKNFINSKEFKNATSIFIFVSYKMEVDTHKIIKKALDYNKEVYVPKIISKREGMKAIKIKSFSELKVGAYGILEPIFDNPIDVINKIDLIVLPGLAFDLNGGRLGYGGGFYDRFLKNTTEDTLRCAMAYDFQIVNNVTMEEFDERVSIIITDKRIIYI